MTDVVLSPHLDDAALSTAAVLAGWHRTDSSTTSVVNVFTGAPLHESTLSLWDHVCGFTDSGEVAARRIAEDAAALSTLGLVPVNLGYRDFLIRRGDGDPESVTVDDLFSDLADLIVPSEVETVYAPLGGGPRPHVDHVLVREAALLLHRERIADVALYADQPYVYKSRSWPQWIETDVDFGVGPASAIVATRLQHSGVEDDGRGGDWWRRFPRSVPEMVALDNGRTVVVLGEEARDRKLDLMRRYETQFDNLNRRLRTRGLLDDPNLYGVEVYWRLDPPASIEAAA